ncbi:MAG: sigma-70 family RNA polymerase sigma factor [Candidatus Wildermuthbacteria bacterium]|nr:sigma-70 family RNA polymerase sigma factor [Candidatus Wildermuthbacteria bacterium]
MEQIRAEFSKIYDTYNGKIYRFIYLKVESREVAEDLASEVFLSAWETFQKGQNPEPKIKNIQAYLYQIARNTVSDHHGSKKVRTVSVEEYADIPDRGDPIEEQAMISLEIERVKGFLKELNNDYQDLIIWKYLDELSYPEIAQITGKTEDTVRVNVHRAMQALKGKLEATVTK